MKNIQLIAVLFVAPITTFAADENTSPNLIIILADDMGYSDPGCFGGEIATPNIDRLAGEGVRLTRFYNGGMCVISRASMLTGNWWPRAVPKFKQTPLVSERLHAAGYRTALIGKWHLNGHPLDRGFDHFFGFLGGFADHFSGSSTYRLNREPYRDFGENYYSSDALTDRAIKFIEDSCVEDTSSEGTSSEDPSTEETEKPFFLYLSYQAPHNPLQAPRADILKYRGKYAVGWQAVREARFRRQKELGVVSADATLPAYPRNLPQWNSLTDEQRDLEDLRMAVYAAMVERMDHGIGQVLESLEKTGHANDTLVLFLSDNGTDSFSVVDQAMLKKGLLPGDRGSNWQPGTGWAYASVTPWRQYKIGQHAGGVTSGAVAWWPGKTGTPGRIDSSALHMVDVLPTFLEAAAVDKAGSESIAGMALAGDKIAGDSVAGESFLPLLRGQSWRRSNPLYFQYMDNRAIRTDQWTMAEVDGSGWELFDAQHDPLETADLAITHPEVVSVLEKQWLDWWCEESGNTTYVPESAQNSPHYSPQGDRGSGKQYRPSTMPARLSGRYKLE